MSRWRVLLRVSLFVLTFALVSLFAAGAALAVEIQVTPETSSEGGDGGDATQPPDSLRLAPNLAQATACVNVLDFDPTTFFGSGKWIQHSAISSSYAWAGTFHGWVAGVGVQLYCTNSSLPMWGGTCYQQGTLSGAVAYILNQAYPYGAGLGTPLADADEEAAAVQLAIWNITPGIAIKNGSSAAFTVWEYAGNSNWVQSDSSVADRIAGRANAIAEAASGKTAQAFSYYDPNNIRQPLGRAGGGCSRTIGYWKTHAGFGPQADVVTPLLPIWLGTVSGAESVKVTMAAQAVTLLRKSDDASNGINKLYAQLLAAKLNFASGADNSAVASTIAAADAFLATKNSADWSSLTSAEKQTVLGWMTMLDNYNNGLLGPGHCSE